MTDNKFLASRLAWVFRSVSGGAGEELRLFDELSQFKRDRLLALVALEPDEEPVLGAHALPEDWLLMTTSRIEWQADTRTSLRLSEIESVDLDYKTLPIAKRAGGRAGLLVTTRNERTHLLTVESGYPLYGLFNVLLRAI